jgi:hypothetical protein
MNHCPLLAHTIANGLLYYAILPVIVSTTCLASKPTIGINTALFLLRQVYNYINYQPAIQALTQMIFLPFHSNKALTVVQEYPADVRYYSFTWIAPNDQQPFTFTECKVLSKILDVLFNYNDDMEYFWDNSKKFLEPYASEYVKEKDEIEVKFKGEKKMIDTLKKRYRGKLLEKLGADIIEIKNEHLKLSRAFGLPIGTVKTLRPDFIPISLIEYCNENISLIKENKYPLSNYKQSEFPSNFFVLLTVLTNTNLRPKMIR